MTIQPAAVRSAATRLLLVALVVLLIEVVLPAAMAAGAGP
jgi:hypothetical protein